MAIQQQANNSDQVPQYDKSHRSRDDDTADQLKCLLIAIETDRFDARQMATLPLKHYLQVTDDHFAKAVKSGAESGAVDAKSGSQAAHFPAQQPAASSRMDTKRPLTESGVTRGNASECGALQDSKTPPWGER
jgi:hypothetical protein